MLKSPMPPVYVPRHQVVKAKSFPAKRRVHSSWIGQRTCVNGRLWETLAAMNLPWLGMLYATPMYVLFWRWDILGFITLLLLWIMYWLGFIIPNSWSWNHLQLFGWSTHYSFTTHSPPAAQQKTPRCLGSIDGTPGTHQQLLWREKLPVRLRHRGDRFDGAGLQGSGPQHG